ncbi:MAG: pilus assembly PilX N-terminal domain-containing protein [Candidatus Zixiibacteriota bacterium]|nr:MAG: pilus assembly PilX N-terminal domain-containing protein [candidate division Zixibacteria bacterium]
MYRISKTAGNSESGVVLIVCMIILLMLSLIGIASITTSNSEMQVAGNEMSSTGAFYAAEAGLEKATSEIITSYENTGAPPSPLPTALETMNNYRYYYYVSDLGPAAGRTLTYGSYNGLYATVKSFEIISQGVDNNLEAGVEIEMDIEDALIPVYQFAVFYENLLEIGPGPDMTVSGRLHSNSDTYVEAGSNLFMDQLSSAGNIYYGTAPGSGDSPGTGNILIKDGNGNYQNMRNGDGTYLDATDPDWVNSSISRWGNTVEDHNHGITDLYMPIAGAGNPVDMIDRAESNPDSYENLAGLKFVDGQALYRQIDGTWLDVTGLLIADGTISASTFYDEREGQNVLSLDLDVSLLAASGYYPPNGIIYSSQPEMVGNITAIRLTNGSQLPSGLTVATNNPLYTLGDFNSVNKRPASLMADAITILSNSWDDASSGLGIGARAASATTVNAAYITGNTETGSPGHDYSGGLENLPRFLENWNGVTFTWKGSAVSLWYSRQAISPYGMTYYNPPVRDWGFDTDFLDAAYLPPGTPMVNVIMKTGWNQTVLDDFSNFTVEYGGDIY